MASATSSSTLALSSSSTLVDGKPPRHSPTVSPQCVTLPKLLPPSSLQYQNRSWKSTPHCRQTGRNIIAMSSGEAQAEVAGTSIETTEILKTVQEAWENLEDKYAVTSLVVAGIVVLWTSTGVVSALDRLPLVPGVLELVGIGYTGWFAYKNLIYKPEREALIQKIKDTYKDVIGSGGGSSSSSS